MNGSSPHAYNFYDASAYYDEDDCLTNSPPLKPVRLDPKPYFHPWLQPGGDEVDDFDLDTPWTPELRVSTDTTTSSQRLNPPYLNPRAKARDPSPLDRILLDTMCGRDPSIGMEAQFRSLDYDSEYDDEPELDDESGSEDCDMTSMDHDEHNDLGLLQGNAGGSNKSSLRDGVTKPISSTVNTIASAPKATPTRNDKKSPENKLRDSVRRWGLPLDIQGLCGSVSAMTCADSGSDDNVISRSFAMSLGLTLSDEQDDKKDFSLANGKIIKSLGKVESPCNFASGIRLPTSLVTAFYVFETLAVDVIMGMAFLEATKTFTEHRDRLVEIQVQRPQALRVQSIGMPRRHLLCRLNDRVALANVDSGSDIDLVSSKYAGSRFSVRPNEETIMFADGSTETTSGIARLTLLVPGGGLVSKAISKEFHLFDNLTHNVLIGHDTIELLRVFTEHDSALIPVLGSRGSSDLNIIRHLRDLKVPYLRKCKESIKRLLKSVNPTTIAPDSPDHDDDDQWENARHSEELERIEAMADETEAARLRDEEILRHKAYIAASRTTSAGVPVPTLSSSSLHSDSLTSSLPKVSQISSPQNGPVSPSAIPVGRYVCTFQGCTAAPFETQYLLSSHSVVHSTTTPYYCHVPGCSRAQGGRGFKRRTEMIRHSLVHDTPGYLCPFCPDREHKYPRPDNLERHVRVHHPDKSRDDLGLRAVLTQRPSKRPGRGV